MTILSVSSTCLTFIDYLLPKQVTHAFIWSIFQDSLYSGPVTVNTVKTCTVRSLAIAEIYWFMLETSNKVLKEALQTFGF